MSITPVFYGRTHKESETINDCQDYFQINEAESCFAIADGASQSFSPSIWAELLVNYFCRNPEINPENWQTWLQLIQEKWLEEVKNQVEKATIKAKNENSGSWVTNHNRLVNQHSATSTFIGLRFIENQVQVSIVGDSCLFILDDNHFTPYLLKSSEDFGNRPEYFASYSKDNDFKPNCFSISLEIRESSAPIYFILATDALSEYIFKCVENEKDIFTTLVNISSQQDFENFVTSARNSDSIRMKNDDVTLMILAFDLKLKPSIKKNEAEKKVESSIITLVNTETEEITETSPKPVNEQIKNNPQEQIKKLAKQNRNLKLQRFIFGILAFILLLFIAIDKTISMINHSGKNNNLETTTNKNPITKLPIDTIIYTDQSLTQILVESLPNSFEVVILEQGDNWIKISINLYAYKSIINNCPSCANDEIYIQANKNIRVFPSQSDQDIFGQLTEESKFKKLEFDSLENWYKFKLVGYIKK